MNAAPNDLYLMAYDQPLRVQDESVASAAAVSWEEALARTWRRVETIVIQVSQRANHMMLLQRQITPDAVLPKERVLARIPQVSR